MKIATILPLHHMKLEVGNDYHLALAHLVRDSPTYANFFLRRAQEGHHVILDNGVVETGEPMGIERLVELGRSIRATEVVLPDALGDSRRTIRLGLAALPYLREAGMKAMVVPQGKTQSEWAECAHYMLTWPEPVAAMGISRFSPFSSRSQAITWLPTSMTLDIHLLGCKGDPSEIHHTTWGHLPIRGADSGVAAFWTAADKTLTDLEERPEAPSDFDFLSTVLDEELLIRNRTIWRNKCLGLV